LMQDRTSANSMKVLLQRTAGPYIWVKSGGNDRENAPAHVRFAPESGQTGRRFTKSALCQSRPFTPESMPFLFDHPACLHSRN
jgi:hypothetical protein